MDAIYQTCLVKLAVVSLPSNGSDGRNLSLQFFTFYETPPTTSLTYGMSILDFDVAFDYNHTFGTPSNFNGFFLF